MTGIATIVHANNPNSYVGEPDPTGGGSASITIGFFLGAAVFWWLAISENSPIRAWLRAGEFRAPLLMWLGPIIGGAIAYLLFA